MPVAVWSPTDRDIPPPPDFDVWTPEDRDIPPPPDLEAVSPFPASPAPDLRNTRTNAITGEQSVIPPSPPRDPLQRLPSMEDRFRAELATDPVMEAVLYPGILNDKGKWHEAVHYYQKNRDSIPKEFGEKFKSLAREIQPSQQLTRQEENELGVATAKRDLEQAWFPNIKAAAVQGGSDIDSIVARLIGANKTADDLVRMASEYEQAAEKIDEKSVIPKVLRQGARGAMRTLPAAAGAAMVAGPYGAIGYASATEANNAYTRGKDAGLAGNALTNYVASHAVIEAVPAAIMQRAGLGGLESFLGGKGAASKGVMDALKNLGVQTLQEVPEEVATELLHNLEDASSKVDPEAATPANLWKTAYQTTVQTLMTLGFANAPAIGVHSMEGAANFLNAKSRSDAEKLGYGRTSKADRAEMMRLALNYFQKPKEKAAAAESVGVLEAKEAEPDRDELLQWAEKQVAKPVEPPLSEGALPNAEQVQVPGPLDGGGRPQPEIRPEGGRPAESGKGVQPSRQGDRNLEGQAVEAAPQEVVGQPANVPPVAVELEVKRSIYARNPEHEALARRAAAGEAVEKPEGISDNRWKAMVKQAALPPVEPVPVETPEAVETPTTPPSAKKRPTRGKKASVEKQAEENARQYAVENGLDPAEFLDAAKNIYQGLKEIDDARREAKREIGRNINSLTIDRVRKRGGDYAGVRGFDTLTEKVIGNYPEAFGTELARQSPNDAVWELATTKVEDLVPIRLDDPKILEGAQRQMRPPTTDPMEYRPERDAYQTATDQFISRLPLAERAKAAREKFLNSAKILGEKLIDQNRPFSGIDPQYFVDAANLVHDAARAGVLTFAEVIEKISDYLGEHLDALRPTLVEAWNREADRNPKLKRAPAEESMDFDWETGTFMQGPVAPEKPAWKKTFEEAPEASQAEIFDVGRGDLPGQESLFEKDTMGKSQAEWEREQAAPAEPPPRQPQPPPPSEPQRTPGGLPRGPEITAARNAITEAITGIPHPPVDKTGHTQPELFDQADPQRAQAIVERFNADPKTVLSDQDTFDLTYRLKQVRDARERALKENDQIAEAVAADEVRQLTSVLQRAGTAQGRALASRQANINEDWSLGHMLEEAEMDKGGIPLTREEKAKIGQLSETIQKSEEGIAVADGKAAKEQADKVVDKVIQEIEAELPPDYDPKVYAIGKRIKDWADKLEQHGLDGLKKLGVNFTAGLDPRAAAYLIEIGTAKLVKTGASFAEWTADMVSTIGPKVGHHLADIWDEVQKGRDRVYEKASIPENKKPAVKKTVSQRAKVPREEMTPEEQVSDIAGKLQKRINNKGAVNYLVSKLMRVFAEEGIDTREPMYDAVHSILSSIDPNWTRRQTIDAAGGYGDYKPPSTDEVSRIVADIRAQSQKVSALADIANKKAPKRSGKGRLPPTDETRALSRQVVQEMRKQGIQPTDEETQQRSILQSLKTQATHRISDMQEAIDSNARIPRNKIPRPTDEELQRLEQEEGVTREAYETKFAADIEIDRLEKSIAYVGDQISRAQKGEDIWKGKVAAPKARNAAIDALQANLDALKAERDAMRAANAGVQARRAEVQEAAARRRIEELKSQFETGQIPEGKAKQPSLVSPETKAELSRLTERLKAVKKAKEEANMTVWEGEGGATKQRIPTPESRRLQIAIEARKASLLRSIADYKSRQAEGQFGPRPVRKPLDMPKEVLDLVEKREKAKADFEAARQKWQWDNKTALQKSRAVFEETLNTSRSIITSFDFSAVLRQGGFAAFSHPILAAKALPEMFRAAFSKRGAIAAEERLKRLPNAPLHKQSGLASTSSDTKLFHQEENFMGRWSRHIPGVAASERAYVAFLNRMRTDVFDSMVAGMGRTGRVTLDEAKMVAGFVNAATGRGGLGTLQSSAVPLATYFFSPRFLSSRIQLLTYYPAKVLLGGKSEVAARKAIAKEYARYIAGIGLFYGAIKLASLFQDDQDEDKIQLDFDPRSSDFGKVRMGDARVDPLSGFSQVVVLAGRVGTGETKNTAGKITPIRGPDVPYGGATTTSTIGNFMRSKLSPWLGTAINVAAGENAVGEPVTPQSTVVDVATPLAVRDIYEAMQDQGIPRGSALGLLSIFGMGMQVYSRNRQRRQPSSIGKPKRKR